MKKKVNRKYKDRLFSYIFGREENKAWTLSLYNAVNGTNYQNPDEIEINTIEDALYMGMKNDVSFIFDSSLSLYEQQSTFNPNMPVRQLIYLGSLYDKYISEDEHRNIYSSRQIALPVPRLITFYNGEKDVPDDILRLSDAFENKDLVAKSDVTVNVHLINIGSKADQTLLQACKPLSEYSWLVEKIRQNKKTMKISGAVDSALKDMPDSFIIKKYLTRHRAEVKGMLLTEYNEAKVMQQLKEEALEDARKEVRDTEHTRIIRNMLSQGLSIDQIICYVGCSPDFAKKVQKEWIEHKNDAE